ncbi:MAG: 4'-phosphopantetheinyl transferase family protein [Acidobacteriota bacterium]
MQTSTTADVYIQMLNAPAQGAGAPDVSAISEQEVHVWTVELTRIPVLAEAFSRDEHDRAARFNSEESRWRFRAARSALRMILASYLKLPPSTLVFGQTEFGKPFLINSEADGLLFNLSYAGNLAVIAVARDREVGVDIEPVRTESVSMDVAAQVFSVAEIYTLSGLNSEQQRGAFVNCWTRKQAYIKARGTGAALPLDQFDVSLAPGVPAAMLGNRGDSILARWVFQDLQLPPDYIGAVVFESLSSRPQLSYFAISL